MKDKEIGGVVGAREGSEDRVERIGVMKIFGGFEGVAVSFA